MTISNIQVSQLPASVVTDASASPKKIDSTGIADGQVLAYSAGSGKLLAAPAAVTGSVGSSQAAQAFLKKLKRNAENAQVVVVGDSTGVDQPAASPAYNRWVYQWAVLLAAQWPQYTFRYHAWDDAAGQYDGPGSTYYTGSGTGTTPVTLQTGTGTGNSGGPFVCDIYNGSISGTIFQSPLGCCTAAQTTVPNTTVAAGSNGATVANGLVLQVAALPAGLPTGSGLTANIMLQTSKGMLTVPYTATGANTITLGTPPVANATVSTGFIVASAPRYPAMVRDIQPDLILVSYGKNESTPANLNDRIAPLIEQLKLDCTDSDIIMLAQCPNLNAATPNISVVAGYIERYATQRGCGFIDVNQYFIDNGYNVAGNYAPSNNIHPNGQGSAYWAALVNGHFAYAPLTQPRPRVPSSLMVPVGSLLTNSDMGDFSNALNSWTLTNATAAKNSQQGLFEGQQNVYSIQLVSSGAGAAYMSQLPGQIMWVGLRGQWVTLCARIWVPPGADANAFGLGISDGISGPSYQTTTTEGQGFWRWAMVSWRMNPAATNITCTVYAGTSGAPGGETVYVDRVCLVRGRLPREPLPRQQGTWNTDVAIRANGKKWRHSENANDSQGIVNLVGGTVTVNTTAVESTNRVRLTAISNGGGTTTWGELSVTASTAGTSFTITSSNPSDTRTIFWELVGVN